jgi:hypothetical protein
MPDVAEQLVELSELRRRGSLSQRQFETARAQLLRIAQRVPSPKQELEIELTALDRAWNARQGEFKVQWGFFWRIPGRDEGTQKAKLFLAIGSLVTTSFTALALGATLTGGDLVLWLGPIFGFSWTLYWFRFYKSWDRIADAYEQAGAEYEAKRAQIEAKIRLLQEK